VQLDAGASVAPSAADRVRALRRRARAGGRDHQPCLDVEPAHRLRVGASMSRPAVEVADVDEHTLPAARTFLEHYPETALFILSNIRAFGPRLGDSLYSGNLKVLRQEGSLRGVFCLTRGGSLLAQTAGDSS